MIQRPSSEDLLKGSRILVRTCRKTGLKVELWHLRLMMRPSGPFSPPYFRSWYWCRCEHEGVTEPSRLKSWAVDQMPHPDRWCGKCRRVVKRRKEGALCLTEKK